MDSVGDSHAGGTVGHRVGPMARAMAEIWTTAAFLRDKMQDDTRSVALRWAAQSLEEAMQEDTETLLTVKEAVALSGAKVGAIRRALTSGSLPNVGQPHRPRIRSGDLAGWTPPRGRQGPQSARSRSTRE